MKLLKKLFSSEKTSHKEEKNLYINWIPLKDLDQLEEIKEFSKMETVAIFKHSTRCIVSRSVLKQFENSFDEETVKLKVYYLDLLNYREIANEVGYQFQVIHQSPQLLIIKDEVAVAFASHYDIMAIDLKKYS